MSAARSRRSETYERALASADWVRNRAGVPLAGLDVGGGFPAAYGHDPKSKARCRRSEELMGNLRRASPNGSLTTCRWSPNRAG
jgi:diaminopimelate decarboxylase